MSLIRDFFKTGQDMAASIWNEALEAAARECEREASDLRSQGRWQGYRRMIDMADRIRGLRR